jgi:hypothetical protein
MDAGNAVNYAEVGSYAQWAGAGMTALAIGVALFKESIIRRLRHPKLKARLEAGHPDCVKTPTSHEDKWQGSRYFLRLWITNVGNVRAEDVEVFLSQAWVEQKGSFEELPQFTPMNLRWSYSDYQKPTINVDGISPRMGRYCDFGAISDPAHPVLKSLPENSGKTRLSLVFQFLRPAADWLKPGKYKFEVLLSGSNCEPVAWVVALHLTGLWSDDETEMFANGFVAEVREG